MKNLLRIIDSKTKKVIFLSFLTIIISLLEITTFKRKGVFSVLASRIWLGWFFIFLLIIIEKSVKNIFYDIKKGHFLTILSLITTVFFISFNLKSFPINISGEATQQLAAGLAGWQQKDFAYTENAFLGNPIRQFLIASIPSKVLGKSIETARLGYILPFIFGVFLFYIGIKTYYKKHLSSEFFAALATISLISFPVVPVLLRTFEQITNPIAYSLQALGSFLILKNKPSIINWLLFSWTLIMLPNIYAPALSVWTLFIAVLLFLSVTEWKKNKYHSCIWTTGLFLTLVFGVVSLNTRQDVKLLTKIDNPWTIFSKVSESIEYYFYQNTDMYNQNLPFIGRIIFLPVVIYIISSLTLYWGPLHFILTVWMLATIVISGLSPGYAQPGIYFAIHRSIITIPFLIWGISDLIIKRTKRIIRKYQMLIFLVFLIFNSYLIFHIKSVADKTYEKRSFLLRKTLNTSENYNFQKENKTSLFTYTPQSNFRFMEEQLEYFFPNSNKNTNVESCPVEKTLETQSIIYTDELECAKRLKMKNSALSLKKIQLNYDNKNFSLIEAVNN